MADNSNVTLHTIYLSLQRTIILHQISILLLSILDFPSQKHDFVLTRAYLRFYILHAPDQLYILFTFGVGPLMQITILFFVFGFQAFHVRKLRNKVLFLSIQVFDLTLTIL